MAQIHWRAKFDSHTKVKCSGPRHVLVSMTDDSGVHVGCLACGGVHVCKICAVSYKHDLAPKGGHYRNKNQQHDDSGTTTESATENTTERVTESV